MVNGEEEGVRKTGFFMEIEEMFMLISKRGVRRFGDNYESWLGYADFKMTMRQPTSYIYIAVKWICKSET